MRGSDSVFTASTIMVDYTAEVTIFKKDLKKSFEINLFAPVSILAQRSKVHNLFGAYESRAKHTRLGVKVVYLGFVVTGGSL